MASAARLVTFDRRAVLDERPDYILEVPEDVLKTLG